MDPRYILFDMDGVLIDSGRSIIESTAYTLSRYGLTLGEEQKRMIIGPPLHKNFTDVFGFDENTAKEAAAVYKKYYEEHALSLVSAFPDVEEMLQILNAHGKKLMVATVRYVDITEKILDMLGLSQYFCFTGGVNAPPGSSEPGAVTNKKEVINYCLTENGILDRECAIMVGDRREDIEGGIANGILTIGAAYGYGTIEELENAGAHFIAPDPLSVCRHIIEDF